MESREFEHKHEVQDSLADGNAEISQLQKTIASLREELEHQRMSCNEKIATMSNNHNNERQQLQDTIQSLREKLEDGNTK